MKKFFKNLWRAYKCISQKDSYSTWEELRESYHRDPKDFQKIRQDDTSFKRWVEDVIKYDETVSDIIEYRLRYTPFEQYFENGIPFSQISILLQGVIKEYYIRQDSPLETDFLDYLENYPVSKENFDLLLQEIDKIKSVTERGNLREKIQKLKEKVP